MKVQILMSTYNGERYICTQLDSIVQQRFEEMTLLIRDDGSVDNTFKIIKAYQERYPWIFVYQGENIGVQRSYFDLLVKSDADADYIAFADQDDFWLPGKIERAVYCLREMQLRGEKPLLYCGSQIMVGESLEPLKQTVSRTVRRPAFGNALVQNICTGCTAVVNRALAQLLRDYVPNNIDHIVMHDWWLYLTASCFGDVYYDETPYIKYRQHRKNAHGAILSRRSLLKYRLGQLMRPRGEIYQQTKCFKKTFSQLLDCDSFPKNILEDNRKKMDLLLKSKNNVFTRIQLVLDRSFFRQKPSDDLVFRAITLIGKL